MTNQKDILTSIQSVALFIAYFIVMLAVFLAGWYGLNLFFIVPGAFIALYVILFLLSGSLLGAWLWVLIKIPQGIARDFDEIKNKIASGEISNSKDFSISLAEFLIKYFNFFRFDVVTAIVKVKAFEPVVLGEPIPETNFDAYKFDNTSQETESVIPLGKIKSGNATLYGYLVPIWFGKEWLGYS